MFNKTAVSNFMAANLIKDMNLNSMNGDTLAEKLRRENLDKFNTLVRMHLSFVLDLSTNDNEAIIDKQKLKKWSFTSFSNKKSRLNRGIMDGLPLTQEGICQVYQLIEFLKTEPYICSEGIFRRTGSLTRQQELRNLLNRGVSVILDGITYSVHDCASVLKGFLAELPEPLLTDAHYLAHCQIAELFNIHTKSSQEVRLLHALQLLLLLLPSENRILFKDVLNLLHLTASYEGNNKMSAENLATIFTPHLLCPRNLSPEGLHLNLQMLAGILTFMIKKCSELFHVPPQLTVDIRAHYSDRERRKLLSPKMNCNESISDNYAASTVYSFTDVERTAKENQSNPTETALAQLYAYIQGLPESSKKRKLIKQFNKENGCGTPLPIVRTNVAKNKSIGSSIKKHIFHKNIAKSVTKNGGVLKLLRSSSEEILDSPFPSTFKAKLFCNKCDTSSTDLGNDENVTKKFKKSNVSTENILSDVLCELNFNEIARSASDPNISTDKVESAVGSYLTSTPARFQQCACPDMSFTPQDQGQKSMSPITRSTQRMSRAMQETMMTPRSRKPVLVVSGTNINNLPKIETQDFNMDSVQEEITDTPLLPKSRSMGDLIVDTSSDEEDSDVLTDTFREYLHTRSTTNVTPTDLSFSSCTDDYYSTAINNSHLSSSLLHCLNGFTPPDEACNNSGSEKKLVLRPKQFDTNGKPIVYETSFLV